MSLTEPGLQRLRMSWQEYLELPEKPKAEWVDGEVVVSPPVAPDHGISTAELIFVLKTALPDLVVMAEVGVRLPGNRVRAPDIMLSASRPTTTILEEAPVLVVEVLSPSTRAEDTIRKAPEYAAAGVGQFWVVDPDHLAIDVYENVVGVWELLLHLDEQHPTGEVAVGEHGTVSLDVGSVFPR